MLGKVIGFLNSIDGKYPQRLANVIANEENYAGAAGAASIYLTGAEDLSDVSNLASLAKLTRQLLEIAEAKIDYVV